MLGLSPNSNFLCSSRSHLHFDEAMLTLVSRCAQLIEYWSVFFGLIILKCKFDCTVHFLFFVHVSAKIVDQCMHTHS